MAIEQKVETANAAIASGDLPGGERMLRSILETKPGEYRRASSTSLCTGTLADALILDLCAFSLCDQLPAMTQACESRKQP